MGFKGIRFLRTSASFSTLGKEEVNVPSSANLWELCPSTVTCLYHLCRSHKAQVPFLFPSEFVCVLAPIQSPATVWSPSLWVTGACFLGVWVETMSTLMSMDAMHALDLAVFGPEGGVVRFWSLLPLSQTVTVIVGWAPNIQRKHKNKGKNSQKKEKRQGDREMSSLERSHTWASGRWDNFVMRPLGGQEGC